jgi:hypothetical protein
MAYNVIDNDYLRCADWVSENTNQYYSDMITLIGLEKNGELIAVSAYNCFNGTSCQQHMVIKKGEYMTRNFAWFIYYYPFVQLGLTLLIGILPEDNADIIKLAKHAGFEEKYRIDGGHPEGDLLLCTMKKEDCRFLKYKIKG